MYSLPRLRSQSLIPKAGLQLWTVRNSLAADPGRTLEIVAGMGYQGVEFIEPLPLPAKELREMIVALGLEAVSLYTDLESVEAADVVFDRAKVLGCAHLVVDAERTASGGDGASLVRRLESAGLRCGASGLTLGVHNHRWEFDELDEGGTILDLLISSARGAFELELDLGWAWVVGHDPTALLRRCRGLCSRVHLKDFSSRSEHRFAPLGEGLIDIAPVVSESGQSGVAWLLVEQDLTYDLDELDAAARSARHLLPLLAASGVG